MKRYASPSNPDAGQSAIPPTGALRGTRMSNSNDYMTSIANHLEALTRIMCAGINKRRFNLGILSAHDYVDPRFRASPPRPWAGPPVSWNEFVRYFVSLIAEAPEFKATLLELNTVVCPRTARSAQVFGRIEMSGYPSGLIRQTVGVLHFRFFEGKWRLYSCESFDGIDSANHILQRPRSGGAKLS